MPPPARRVPPPARRTPPPPRIAPGARKAPPPARSTPAPAPAPTEGRDPRLEGTPAGSELHVVRIDGKESWTILTGWRHLLTTMPEGEDPKKNAGMVYGECGAKGRPYVWKGVGTRVTSQTRGVTCPKCKATPRYARMQGQAA